jgi:predicted RNase H-like nuclease (RuvC/YqgF family)
MNVGGIKVDFLAVVMIIAIMGAVIYKRHVFDKKAASHGALDAAALGLKESMEATAEMMIQRIKEEAEQLTFIISEADTRIHALDERIKKIDAMLEKSAAAKEEIVPLKKAAEETSEKLKKASDVQSELNKRIFSLLDKGYDKEYISRIAGVGKGAIELIEQMYENNKKHG